MTAPKTEGIVIGDVVKFELPMAYCRQEAVVGKITGATAKLPVGQLMEPSAAVAEVQTSTVGSLMTGGTFRLGYKGQWTADIAFDASVAETKTALELLSTVAVDDIVQEALHEPDTELTCTWTFAIALGNVPMLQMDITNATMATKTVVIVETVTGALVAEKIVCTTGGNCDCILLEEVTLDELKSDWYHELRRAFLVRGSAIVNSDRVTIVVAQKATAIAALEALGIQFRTEAEQVEIGTPSSGD